MFQTHQSRGSESRRQIQEVGNALHTNGEHLTLPEGL
jgi:hypothetical protein